jgi:hypothetical protein
MKLNLLKTAVYVLIAVVLVVGLVAFFTKPKSAVYVRNMPKVPKPTQAATSGYWSPPSTPQPTENTPPTEFPPTFGQIAEYFGNQNPNPAVLANGKGVNWGFGGPGNFWWYPQAKCTSNWECGYGTCNASGFCV